MKNKEKPTSIILSLLAVIGLLVSGATVTVNPVMPGSIIISLTSCPSGYNQVTALEGVTLRGTLLVNGDVGNTGGSDLLAATGTISAPTFTGNSVNSSSVSGGTPSGTVSQPIFAGDAVASTKVSGGTPSGTVDAPVFTGTALGTHAHTEGTLTAAAQIFTGSSSTVGAQTFTGSSSTVGAQTFTGSSSTVAAQTISWPAGVPTNTAESSHTHSGSTLTAAAQTFTGTLTTTVINHTHGLSFARGATTGAVKTTQGFTSSSDTSSTAITEVTDNPGGGAANYTPAGTNGTSAVSGNTGAGSSHNHNISWPAGVPTNATSTVTPLGSNGTSTVTPLGSNSTSTVTPLGSNGSSAVTGTSQAVSAGTPAGTNSAPTFTGNALATHQHDTTATGTVSQPTFGGDALSGHLHATTATGSISVPTFTGDSIANVQAYVKVIFCVKT